MDDLRQTGVGDACFTVSFSRVRRLSSSFGLTQERFTIPKTRRGNLVPPKRVMLVLMVTL